jgi:hypothetical protein
MRDSIRSRPRRAGVLAAALAGIALLAAACGGTSPTGGSGSYQTAYQKELAYAQCMRAHADPGFPDPQNDGSFTTTKANRGDFTGPRAQSANKACAHLQGRQTTPVQFQQGVSQALKFVVCMRAHGITSFPEPEVNRNKENIIIGFTPASGIDPDSPQFQAAQKACQKLPLARSDLGDGGP